MESHEISQLYRDGAFARRLAAGLAGASASEDVWQEAFRALLARPPRARTNLEGYLRTLVRRLALRHRRGEGRRVAREQAALAREPSPSAAEVAQRMELHRVLVDELIALEEPYRRTLYLVFFEDLSAAEIARRDELPLETVRTRTRRGLARLRERLLRREERARDWLAGLVPGPRVPVVARRAWRVPALAAGAVVGLAALGAWLRVARPTARAPALADSSEHPAAREESLPPARAPVARIPEPPGPMPVEPAPLARDLLAVGGRVLDAQGRPIPGAEVALRLGSRTRVLELDSGRTDADGRYTLAFERPSILEAGNRWLEIEANATGWGPLCLERYLVDLQSDGVEQDLTLLPADTCVGRVLDVHGNPVHSALVNVHVLSDPNDGGLRVSDGRGEFVIGIQPGARVESIEAQKQGIGVAFLAGTEIAPAGSRRAVPDLVLSAGHVVRGTIRDPEGRPVRELPVVARCARPGPSGELLPLSSSEPASAAGAVWARTSSGEDGRFLLTGLREGPWICEADGGLEGPPGPDAVVVRAAEEANLVVDSHRIFLEVVSALDGARTDDVRIAWTRLEPAPAGGWRARGPTWRTTTGPSLGDSGVHGRVPLGGEPGSAWALTVVLPGWFEERVLVIPEDHESGLRIALDPSPPPGLLRLRVPEAGGARLGRFELVLESPLTGVPVGRFTSDEEGCCQGLPCGRLRAWARFLDGPERPEDLPRQFLGELEIGPRLVTHDVALARGSILRVAFAVDGGPEPSRTHSMFEDTSGEWVTWVPPRMEAVLRRSGDSPDAAPSRVLEYAAPGRIWTSAEPLAQGTYRLEVRFPGFLPVSEEIRVEDGETPMVRVRLRREEASTR